MNKQNIITILESEQITASAKVKSMCNRIKAIHKDRVLGFIYYGSSLRDINNNDKMLDFYVLVDSYGKTHKNPLRALLNLLLPPAVYYLENKNEDTSISTCKYSIISLKSFEKKCTKRAFLSQIWGRFSQPAIVLFAKDKTIHKRIQTARANAIKHIASQAAPLFTKQVSAIEFWSRAYCESYKTELRPESPKSRTLEIVKRHKNRYEKLSDILFGAPDKDGVYTLPANSQFDRFICKLKWALRRVLGKIIAAMRIINSAFTFSGGLDYALHKLQSHSGVKIEVTDSQRRHPVLWSPVLAWKLWKKGAFR